MIIRVWGVVNSTEVEFTPIPNRPGYWEGYAPRLPGLQAIEIWAESDSGLRGHLQCSVMLDYHAAYRGAVVGRSDGSKVDRRGRQGAPVTATVGGTAGHGQRCKCSTGKLYCETERLQKGGGIIAGKSRI